MTTLTQGRAPPATPEDLVTEVAEELPRSILRLFWLFAQPYRGTIALMMAASLSLRALSVLQVYAAKRMVDAASRIRLHAPDGWSTVAPPLLGFFAIVGLAMVVEWGAWFCSYSSRIPVLARARQLVFTYAQRHSPTYFDNMLTGKVAHRAMLLPEQTVSLFERTNWDYLPLTVQCGVLLVLFFRAQPNYALALLGWLVVSVLVALAMGRQIAAFGAVHSDAKAQLTGRIVDSITNINNVIFFAAHRAKIASLPARSATPTAPSGRSTGRSYRCGSSCRVSTCSSTPSSSRSHCVTSFAARSASATSS